MAKKIKKRSLTQSADRAYDYLIAHKNQLLKYIVVALITGILQFLAERFLGLDPLLAFGLRILFMFIPLKLWVYPKTLRDGFTIAKELMITIMLLLIATALINSLILFLASLLDKPFFVAYLGSALLEILYFIFFQFIIFKENF